ncbi:MAG: beta-propeller fold lactonase family protein [Burkholderiaceae bacterium]|nr:beta-propeller fold lactonase family protein [Burkholderiaceae bacterium]
MNQTRRNAFKILGLTLALSGLSLPAMAHGQDDDDGYRAGRVFTSTNAVAGNELLVYAAPRDGALSLQARLATQGQGTGTGLGNQGAVTLSGNGRFLFVVNSLSNSVSTFVVRRNGLELRSTVDSGGQRPISVTEHDGVVYVLNAEGAGNVTGFRNLAGTLKPLAGSTQPLSAAGGTGAAQVGFSPDGEVLLVTEKATNKLTSYRVRNSGRIDAPVVTASAGATPFGFAFDRRGHALVSEAFGGAANASAVSSYGFEDWASAKPMLISPTVGTTQTAACWVVVTPSGRHAYVTNTGSGTISRYSVQKSGKVELAQGIAATSGAGPIDAAISADGRGLFVLNSGSNSISSFAIAHDGTLTAASSAPGLPAGSNGLAAN